MLNKFLVITRDKRENYLAEYLRMQNYSIIESNIYLSGNYDGIILPINYEFTEELLTQSSPIFGGNLSHCTIEKFKTKNIPVYDYFNNETVKYKNAVLTAQATMGIILNNYEKSISESKILVLGFGRIGKIICKYLYSWGIIPYVSARKEINFAEIESMGFNKETTGNISNPDKFDIIINTIPYLVIDKDFIDNLNKKVYIIDLSSKPGGVDFEYAAQKQIRCIHALGLPGKFYPQSAGKILASSIINILNERS